MAEIGAFSHPTTSSLTGGHPQNPPPSYDLCMAGATGKKQFQLLLGEGKYVFQLFFISDSSWKNYNILGTKARKIKDPSSIKHEVGGEFYITMFGKYVGG